MSEPEPEPEPKRESDFFDQMKTVADLSHPFPNSAKVLKVILKNEDPVQEILKNEDPVQEILKDEDPILYSHKGRKHKPKNDQNDSDQDEVIASWADIKPVEPERKPVKTLKFGQRIKKFFGNHKLGTHDSH